MLVGQPPSTTAGPVVVYSPPIPSPIPGVEKSLGERVCLQWRTIPGLITLVTCIIGIACTLLVWNSPYLAIPFALGGLCSCYMIYLGHQYQHLKNYAENNENYKQLNRENGQQLSIYIAQNIMLHRSLQTLLGANDKFYKLLDSMSEKLLRLDEKDEAFQKTSETLQIEIQEVANLKEEIKKEVSTLQQNGVNFMQQQGANQERFEEDIEKLETTTTQISQQMNAQCDNLNKLGIKMLANIDLLTNLPEAMKTELANWRGVRRDFEKENEKLIAIKTELTITGERLNQSLSKLEDLQRKFDKTFTKHELAAEPPAEPRC